MNWDESNSYLASGVSLHQTGNSGKGTTLGCYRVCRCTIAVIPENHYKIFFTTTHLHRIAISIEYQGGWVKECK